MVCHHARDKSLEVEDIFATFPKAMVKHLQKRRGRGEKLVYQVVGGEECEGGRYNGRDLDRGVGGVHM